MVAAIIVAIALVAIVPAAIIYGMMTRMQDDAPVVADAEDPEFAAWRTIDMAAPEDTAGFVEHRVDDVREQIERASATIGPDGRTLASSAGTRTEADMAGGIDRSTRVSSRIMASMDMAHVNIQTGAIVDADTAAANPDNHVVRMVPINPPVKE